VNKLLPKNFTETTACGVATAYLKNWLLPLVQFCDELVAYHAAEADSHQILHFSLVAEIKSSSNPHNQSGYISSKRPRAKNI
jgi:hypothetical protein